MEGGCWGVWGGVHGWVVLGWGGLGCVRVSGGGWGGAGGVVGGGCHGAGWGAWGLVTVGGVACGLLGIGRVGVGGCGFGLVGCAWHACMHDKVGVLQWWGLVAGVGDGCGGGGGVMGVMTWVGECRVGWWRVAMVGHGLSMGWLFNQLVGGGGWWLVWVLVCGVGVIGWVGGGGGG